MSIHKQFLIRRYFDQGDIDNIKESNLHKVVDSPYHRDICEWGLLWKDGVSLSYSDVVQQWKDEDITIVPGLRIGIGQTAPSVASETYHMLDAVYWEPLTTALSELVTETDSTKRIMFDVENYSGDKHEIGWSDFTSDEIDRLESVSNDFCDLIKNNSITPLFHPGNYETALNVLLLKASGGVGVAQLELGTTQAIEYLVSDFHAFQKTKCRRLEYAAEWKRRYPEVKIANWTNETVMRKAMQPWKDAVLSSDGLAWVFDEYRDLDTRHHLATLDHYNYQYSHNSSFLSPHDNLRYVWQFYGLDMQERISHTEDKSAKRGNSINRVGGWPDVYVSVREGAYGAYSALDPSKVSGAKLIGASILVDSDSAPNVFSLPWSAVVTFALDPLLYGADGKNSWQRGGEIFRQWKGNDSKLFALTWEAGSTTSTDRARLKLVVGQAAVTDIEIDCVLPRWCESRYLQYKSLIALGDTRITLGYLVSETFTFKPENSSNLQTEMDLIESELDSLTHASPSTTVSDNIRQLIRTSGLGISAGATIKIEKSDDNDRTTSWSLFDKSVAAHASQPITKKTEIRGSISRKQYHFSIDASQSHFESIELDPDYPVGNDLLPLLGSFYSAEFISLAMWDGSIAGIPEDEWPFHTGLIHQTP